jgi:hypothetical protein
MDWDLWIRLARHSDFMYIEKDMASYRWLGSNKTAEGGLDRLDEVEAVARRYGCKGLPAYFRLEKARQLAGLATEDLKQLNLWHMSRNLAKTIATIFTSWGAMKSLINPHIWRNLGTSRTLYRHVRETKSDCP